MEQFDSKVPQPGDRPVPGALSRELRRRGLTQADAERLTGLSRSVLAKVNRGESVSEKTVGLIGKLLDEHAVSPGADAILGIVQSEPEQVPA